MLSGPRQPAVLILAAALLDDRILFRYGDDCYLVAPDGTSMKSELPDGFRYQYEAVPGGAGSPQSFYWVPHFGAYNGLFRCDVSVE
jgi:hypothetical protein